MGVFYATPIFKVGGWILGKVLQRPSTDQEAQLLAQGRITRFAAWSVEARQIDQTVLAAGRTRSWLMALPVGTGSGATALFFGSSITPRERGGLGWQFSALLLFHKLYSRVLLASAVRRLATSRTKLLCR